jgi:hypothetical protein
MAAWPRPRVLPVRSFVLGAAAAACVAALAFVAHRSIEGAAPPPVEASGHVTPNPVGSAALAASSAIPTLAVTALPSAPALALAPAAHARRSMVLTGACPDCRVGGSAVEPGVALASDGALSVPPGARVTLGFALPTVIDASPTIARPEPERVLVDPSVGVDVEGPALASTPDDRTISIERGVARFRGLHDVAVSFPGGHVIGDGATFTVRIDNRGVARVSVEKGRVVVTATATNDARPLEAGAMLEVSAVAPPAARAVVAAPAAEAALAVPVVPAVPATVPAAVPAPAPAPAAEETIGAVANARARFHDGDAAGARTQLEGLARSHDGAVARRAAFTLAEIEMSSGDRAERESGRARLKELTVCPDVRLAADAATLLARSEPSAPARAEAWARYLATSPPSPYRERAMLERAEALFDAGRVSDANVVLGELRSATLSEPQRRQLERLTFRARDKR